MCAFSISNHENSIMQMLAKSDLCGQYTILWMFGLLEEWQTLPRIDDLFWKQNICFYILRNPTTYITGKSIAYGNVSLFDTGVSYPSLKIKTTKMSTLYNSFKAPVTQHMQKSVHARTHLSMKFLSWRSSHSTGTYKFLQQHICLLFLDLGGPTVFPQILWAIECWFLKGKF